MTPTPKVFSSKLLITLLAGFFSILLAMLVTWLISLNQMQYVSQVIDQSKIVAHKMDLVASMAEVARTRTRLTMEMIHTVDPFEKDEISLELNSKATEFAIIRTELFSLGLDQREQDIFQQISNIVGPALKHQRIAADIALSDDPEDRSRASQILLTEVYPRQNIIIELFMKLLREQKRAMESAGEMANQLIARNRQYNYLIFTSVLILSVMVIVLVIRHTLSATDALKTEKDKAQDTIRSLGDAVITTDRNGTIEYVNNTAETLIGQLSSELIGRSLESGFPAYDKDNEIWVWQAAEKLISGEDMSPLSRHISLYSFDEIEYDVMTAISPIVDIHGHTSGVIVSFHDVTQSHQLMKKIQHQAAHDALTGLLNRREFENRVRQALELYSEGSPHAMCLFDLDSFKAVNDSCGHAAGDRLLQQLAEYLKPKLRRSDFFARMGGDEFAVFFGNIDINEAKKISNSLLNAIREFTFIWEGKSFRIGASAGMIGIPEGFSDYDYLYQAADTACYLAKNAGRNQLKVVSVDDATLTQKALESNWIELINRALEEDGFLLYSQVIEPLGKQNHHAKHCEVLLRMQADDGSVISPMAFIPVAERYGMMHQIDFWVFGKICELIHSTPLDNTMIAINLSGQTLSSIDYMEQLYDMAVQRKLPPGRLCLEITETVAIANIELATQFMNKMKGLGCYVALDDFGSGLSSFSYLKDLPLDYIKIDGTFVKGITENQSSLVMIEAIHSVGKKLGLTTIAEYIESAEILHELQQIGIDMGQGYYFGQPLPLEQQYHEEHHYPKAG